MKQQPFSILQIGVTSLLAGRNCRHPQQHFICAGAEVGVVALIANEPAVEETRSIIAVAHDPQSRQCVFALLQCRADLRCRHTLQRHAEAQFLLPCLLQKFGQRIHRTVRLIEHDHLTQLLQCVGGIPRLPHQLHGCLAVLFIVFAVIVHDRANLAELAAHGIADTPGHQTLRRQMCPRAQKLRYRVAVNDKPHGTADQIAVRESGHLVQKHHTGFRVVVRHPAVDLVCHSLIRQSQHKIRLPPFKEGICRLRVRGKAERDGFRTQSPGVVIHIVLLQQQRIAFPGDGGIGAVGNKGFGRQRPVLLLHRLAAHGHGGGRRADAVNKVRAAAGQSHHEGVVIRRGNLQRVRIAGAGGTVTGYHVQQACILRSRGRGNQPFPGVDKIPRLHPGTI